MKKKILEDIYILNVVCIVEESKEMMLSLHRTDLIFST